MGKARMGKTARKQSRAARWEKKSAKENTAASKELKIFRETMILAISEIGYVSLSPLIIVIF